MKQRSFTAKFRNHCTMQVTVSTNGKQGGGKGWGSRTTVMIEDLGGTVMKWGGETEYGMSGCGHVSVAGDSEMRGLGLCLLFAGVLIDMLGDGKLDDDECLRHALAMSGLEDDED